MKHLLASFVVAAFFAISSFSQTVLTVDASGKVVTTTVTGGSGSSNFVVASFGSVTVTNTLDVGQVTATNLMMTFITTPYATNGLAVTNLTVDASRASSHWIVTNAYTLTNWTGFDIPTNQANVTIRVEAPLINRAVTYPTFGNSYGIRFLTNANSTLWTTHTAGVVHVYSFSAWGTNVHASVSAWQ